MSKEIKLTLTDKKNARVEIPHGRKFLNYQPTISVSYSKSGKTPRVEVVKVIYIDGYSIEEAIDIMRKESEGLEDCRLEIERDDAYGNCSIDVNLIGYRPATEEEVVKAETALLKQKKYRMEQKRKAEEREVKKAEEILRKQRPELFKDE